MPDCERKAKHKAKFRTFTRKIHEFRDAAGNDEKADALSS